MDKITTLGIDLAKSVFQLHGVGADGQVLLRRQLRRSQMLEFFQRLPSCLIGMEGRQGLRHWFKKPLATPARITGRASLPNLAMTSG